MIIRFNLAVAPGLSHTFRPELGAMVRKHSFPKLELTRQYILNQQCLEN